MKNLLSLLLALALCSTMTAQQDMSKELKGKSANDAYETMMKNRMNVEFRGTAVEALELNSGETKDFDLIFDSYQRDKESLTARRRILLSEYRDEMKEDDTAKDELDETGDFIENYWELDIAAMELKKDYFDRLEDKIGPFKALAFFAMEDAFQNRVDRMRLLRSIPELVVLEPSSVYYQDQMDDFNDWKSINIDGRVGLDHEFTSTGLKKLLTATEAMAQAEGVMVKDFAKKKQMIMDNADNLTKNWKSLDHANYAKDAFTQAAELISSVARDARFTVREPWINKLTTTANQINVDKKLTDQADTVYTFFDTAESIINDLVRQSGSKMTNMKMESSRK